MSETRQFIIFILLVWIALTSTANLFQAITVPLSALEAERQTP